MTKWNWLLFKCWWHWSLQLRVTNYQIEIICWFIILKTLQCHKICTSVIYTFLSCIYWLWHNFINPYVRKNIYLVQNQRFRQANGQCKSMLLRRYAYGSDWKCSYSFFGILSFPSNTLQQIGKGNITEWLQLIV